MTHSDFLDDGDKEDDIPQVLAATSSPENIYVVFRSWNSYKVQKQKTEEAIRNRADILFNSSLASRLKSYAPENISENFVIVTSQFLTRAQRNAPREPQATASAFSQWVYSLYSNARGDDEDRERGVVLEGTINDSVDNKYLRKINSDWRLVHNGLHNHRNNYINYFNITSLSINNLPLKASPDLIYQNTRTSEVVIVEIKNSYLPIPKNLWPNIWAQLWCYSQIERVLNASKVTVIGEVWGSHWTGRGKKRQKIVYLRASVHRDPRAPAYDRFFRSLFDIYRGIS